MAVPRPSRSSETQGETLEAATPPSLGILGAEELGVPEEGAPGWSLKGE